MNQADNAANAELREAYEAFMESVEPTEVTRSRRSSFAKIGAIALLLDRSKRLVVLAKEYFAGLPNSQMQTGNFFGFDDDEIRRPKDVGFIFPEDTNDDPEN